MRSVRCVGCGETLDPAGRHCPSCGTPAKGAGFEETVAVTLRGNAAVPSVCCCCLGEQVVTQIVKVPMTFEVSMQDLGVRQTYLKVPIPWCRPCRWRSRLLFAFTLLTFAIGSFAALYAAYIRSEGQMGPVYLMAALVAGGVMAGLARTLAMALTPRRAGHVKNCLAVGLSSAAASRDGQEVTLRINLRNRAFAGRWIDAQAGR